LNGTNFVSLLSASVVAMITTDPSANGAMGATIVANISFWQMSKNLRGGGGEQVVNYVLIPISKNFAIMDNPMGFVPPLLSPAQMKVNNDCKIIIENMFQQHRTHRYAAACAHAAAQKLKFAPTYLGPIISTQLNTTAASGLISWTFIGFGVVISIIVVSLFVFQPEERKRYKNEEIVIDVDSSIDY